MSKLIEKVIAIADNSNLAITRDLAVKLGATGYMDQCRIQDFDTPLALVKDEYGRRGVAVKVSCDTSRQLRGQVGDSVMVMFERYMDQKLNVVVAGGNIKFFSSAMSDDDVTKFHDLLSTGSTTNPRGDVVELAG